ncbi:MULTISPECIES: N-acetylglucosamine/diacetylchitobiose ABC transporter substrate-binding protein [unclassified Kitasatospora]|uniref:N-acetylglucosamine/diacetylchitobiose ABC transporter substrate-binding protein n=1 Tax=unclassified Kitasatospora TaxID=2633591 RepID=UPI00364EDB15
MSTALQHHLFASDDGGNDLPYVLSLPDGYADAAEPWPLLLFLHGASERGEDLAGIAAHGPLKRIEAGADLPFVVVAPQCPSYSTWAAELSALAALVREVADAHRVDPDRLYVTGLSMGGTGTWALTARYPGRFAAAVPICGSWLPEAAPRIAHLPVWTFHGAEDRNIPVSHTEKIVAALREAGNPVRFTRYPDTGHDSWTRTYDDPEVYAWLLAQSRSASGALTGRADPLGSNPLGVDPAAPLDVLVFDGGFGDGYVRDAEERYRTAFPHAEVAHTAAAEIRPLLEPRLADGSPPDLVDNTGPASVATAELAAAGRLTDLRPLLAAPAYDDPGRTVADTLIPAAIAKGRFGGEEVWALNHAYTVFGLWYSESTLAKHGWEYPRTWDEMLALCEEAKREGIAGWTFPGKYPFYLQWTLYPFIAKIGGPEVLRAIDNLEPNAWHHDAVRQAFEAYHELAVRGHLLAGTADLDHLQAQTAWTAGKALFIPNGSWVENEAKDTTPPGFDMAVAPPPGLGDTDRMPFGTIWAAAGSAFVVPRAARNPQGGQELLRVLLGRTSAREFTRRVSSLTVVGEAADDLELPPGLASARDLLKAAGEHIVAPRTDWYQDLNREVIAGYIGELTTGRLKPAEAVRLIQQAADRTAQDGSVTKYRHP